MSYYDMSLSEIDVKINAIKKKVRACMDRECVNETISEIHDLRYDIEGLEIAKKIDYMIMLSG